jgi:hypothetical protein
MAIKPQKNKTARGTAARIGEARLVRLGLQNEKLQNEVRRLKGEVAPVKQIKAEVIRANVTVKQQLLALPYRLSSQLANTSDPRECAKIMEAAIVQACNDLAYGTPAEDEICPCYGRAKEEAK